MKDRLVSLAEKSPAIKPSVGSIGAAKADRSRAFGAKKGASWIDRIVKGIDVNRIRNRSDPEEVGGFIEEDAFGSC